MDFLCKYCYVHGIIQYVAFCDYQHRFLAPLSKIRWLVYFWVLYSVPLVYTSLFVVVPYWFCYYDCIILGQLLWFLQHCSFFFFFLWYWGLNAGLIPWATPPAPFVLDIFEIWSRELFAWVGFELQFSWSLPAELLGLQIWATGIQFPFFFFFLR
jgi:hypothetical protein